MNKYEIEGMTCSACQRQIEKAVTKLAGVTAVHVSLLTNSMLVEGEVSAEKVIKAVENSGYKAKAISKKEETYAWQEEIFTDKETPRLQQRLWRSLFWLAILMYLTMGHNMLHWPLPVFLANHYIRLTILQLVLSAIIMYINRDFFFSGIKSFCHLAPNMDTLVALGSGISFLWSIYILHQMLSGVYNQQTLMMAYHSYLYFESAAMIPSLITFGKTLEAYSKGKTTDALRLLIKMAPKMAFVEKKGIVCEIPVTQVEVGDIFICKTGDAIPVDGIILQGGASVDESSLTGEATPVDKQVKDNVFAATLNCSGYFKARATRVGEDTSFAQVIELVKEASCSKAPISRVADRVSGIFVPVVITIALFVFFIWLGQGQSVAFALERAVVVLVISCPCALGLATPVAIMVGSGVAAKQGILFKNSTALERASHANIVVLDKTGTLTKGEASVSDVLVANGVSKVELLSLAYSLEVKSEHPFARAVVNYAKKQESVLLASENFTVVTGNGVEATLQGELSHAGSAKYIQLFANIDATLLQASENMASVGKTPLFFEKNAKVYGLIAVADTVREDARNAISQLKNFGRTVVMLTGDNKKTAQAIAQQVGIDIVIADVLPAEKEKAIRQLQKYGKVLMIGDGINDAPSLTRADLGMAIGAGSDIAIASADIVLLHSRLQGVVTSILLSQACLRIIHENLFWAFAYNAVLIPLAAGFFSAVHITPMWGAAAMSLSSLTVCMNALRLNYFSSYSRLKLAKHNNHPEFTAYLQRELIKYAEEEATTNVTRKEKRMIETFKIEGMMCQHCATNVQKALEAVPGVEKVEVSLTQKEAIVTMSEAVSEQQIKEAIEAANYIFVGKVTTQ